MIFLYRYLIPALWLAWLLYWKLSAWNVKSTVRRESAASRARHYAPLIAAILLMMLPHRRASFLFAICWPPSHFGFWLGAILVMAGLGFAIWARRILGRNWSGTVTLKKEHELIQGGPYARIRHPIYSGLLLAFLGSAIALDQWRGFIAFALVLLAFSIKLRIEERWMTELFGAKYQVYRARTGMLLPKLG